VDHAGLRSNSLVGDVFLELPSHRAAVRAAELLQQARLPVFAPRGRVPDRFKSDAGEEGDDDGAVALDVPSADLLDVRWASQEEWQTARAVFVPRFF